MADFTVVEWWYWLWLFVLFVAYRTCCIHLGYRECILCVCVCVCMFVCMYVCVYVCACVYVCMCICMYVGPIVLFITALLLVDKTTPTVLLSGVLNYLEIFRGNFGSAPVLVVAALTVAE